MVHSPTPRPPAALLETYWANKEAFERRANQMAIRLAHHVRLVTKIRP